MEIQTITLAEMIEFIDSEQVFSMGMRTCDKKKNKGGEWIFFTRACKYVYQTKAERYAADRKGMPAQNELLKNPRHFENSTRNLKLMPSGNIRKTHLRLIREFNGKKVL